MKYSFILSGVVSLSFTLLPACTPQAEQPPEPAAEEAPTTEADVAAIRKVAEEEMAASKAGDLERLFAILSADFERIAPNRPAIRGEQARQEMRDSRGRTSIEFTYSNQEIVVDGGLAYHRYSYDLILTPKNGGESTHEEGAGIQILRRQQDGSWKITKDIWNSDSPPPDRN